MGGGGSQNSTVRNVTEVDPVTQAWRSNIMNAGANLYNQGTPQYYPGQTVVPFADQTQGGLDYLQNYAQQGAPNIGAANDANARALSGWNPAQGFATQWASGASPFFQGINQAANANAAPQVAGMVGGATGANPLLGAIAQSGMNPTTAGVGALNSFANAQNPHLAGLFNQGAEQVTNAVNANFAQAGRFGANAAHTGALSRELGNLYSNIYAPAYESGQNRALQAASMLPGIQQTDRAAAMLGLANAGSLYESGAGRALSGADLMGGLFSSDANRALTGANAAANYGLQGAGLMGDLWSQGNADAARAQALLPSLYQYGQMPGQSMLDIGGMYEGQAQNYLNADRERYDYNANAPWQYLQQYAGMMSGLPDFSGSTQTSTGPRSNRLMSGLGGASAGAGIASALGAGTGWGAGLTGVGALLGLFSDRRLKREIEPLGSNINGTPLYRFAYIWDAPGLKRIGVMADEAPAHAVHTHASGFAVVDYGAL